mgnify:CR=1 FL=1
MTMEINNGYLQENGQIRFLRKKDKKQVKEQKVAAKNVNMNVINTAKIESITIQLEEQTVKKFEPAQ